MNHQDKELWQLTRKNIVSEILYSDFQVVCTLHSKYFNHKYSEPCSCNRKMIKQWVRDLDKLYEKN